MFPNLAKPAFGTGTRSNVFGFDSSSQTNPFGQNQLFGKPTTSGFGASNNPVFGQTGSSVFPAQTSSSLFPNRSVTSFGTQAQTQVPAFGTSVFGTQNQGTTTNLFGNTNTFGTQTKPTSFGFGSTQTQPLLFGQQTQTPPTTNNVFQSSSSGPLFGGASNTFDSPTGTVIKFQPLTGTDTMMKGGIASNINTKHNCITCMKEYESKSLEELRWEDYQANRKGPQQSGFNSTPFGQSNLFGQQQNKTGFGQVPAFGATSTAFGMGSQTPSFFGKPTTGFGTTTTSQNVFSFSNPVASTPFGATQQPKPFATTTPQSMFGAGTLQQTPAFGSNVFGGQNQSGMMMFNKGTSTSAFNSGFSFSQQTQNGLFTTPKSSTSFPLFGQPTTTTTSIFGQPQPAFGQPGQSLFGTSTFGKAPAFGQQQPSFGGGLGLQQGGALFGNAANRPMGSLFASNTTMYGFNSGQQNAMGFLPQHPVSSVQSDDHMQVKDLRNLGVGGHTGHLQFLMKLQPIDDKPQFLRATDPAEIATILKNSSPPEGGPKIPVGPPKSYTKPDLFESFLAVPPTAPASFMNRSRRRLYKNPDGQGFNDDEEWLSNQKIGQPGLQPTENYNQERQPNKNLPIFQMYQVNVEPQPEYIQWDKVGRKTPTKDVNKKLSSSKELSLEKSTTPEPQFQKEDPPKRSSRLQFTLPVETATDEPRRKLNTMSLNSHPTINGVLEEDACGDGLREVPEEITTDNVMSSTKRPTCGVILTRPEYFTYPPLDELDNYIDEDGRCMIQGFTVGRVGYGSIYFPDLIDVSNLNLDEIVHVRHKEVIVYPNNSPPLGEGLNRQAQITLNRIYPKDKYGYAIKDPKKIMKTTFTDNLMKACDEMGTKFVDYRPETGTYIFNVEHFTRYALAEKYETTINVQDEEQQTGIDIEGDLEYIRKQRGMGGDKPLFVKVVRPLMETVMLDSSDLAIQVDMDARKTVVEDGVLFCTDRVDASTQIVKAIDQDFKEEKCMFLRTFATRSHPTISRRFIGRVYADVALFKGRSFKVGWYKSTNYTIRSSHLFPSPTQEIELQDNSILLLSVYKPKPITESVVASLDVIQKHCTMTKLYECPSFNVNRSLDYLLDQETLMSKLIKIKNVEEVQYWSKIWSLCAVLWGPDKTGTGIRRNQFSEWWENLLQSEFILNSGKERPGEEIFQNLTRHQLSKAAQVAEAKKYPRLSLLITMSESLASQNSMKSQISKWTGNGSLQRIEQSILKVYLLLAGVPLCSGANVCDQLDWKRAFGVHLWHVCPYDEPLAKVIETYYNAFEVLKYASKPFPPYDCRNYTNYDVIYHILRLFTEPKLFLDELLLPSSHTNDIIDYSLSWLLLQVFESLSVGASGEGYKRSLHISFAAQLENLGYWKHAVFVALFVNDYPVKKNLVMNILCRNLSADSTSDNHQTLKFLVSYLGISPSWIHSILADKSKCTRNYWAQFQYLLYINDIARCHKVLMGNLVPDLLMNEQMERINKLFMELEPYSETVSEWSTHGKVILEFVKVYQWLMSDKLKHKDFSLAKNKLMRLCLAMKHVNTENIETKLYIAEISKVCSVLIYNLFSRIASSEEIELLANVDSVNYLQMPFDYKIDFYDRAVSHFVQNNHC